MTYLELVRQFFPDADDDEADNILWNETAFPACGVDHMRLQLAQHKCTMEFLCGGPFLTGEEEIAAFLQEKRAIRKTVWKVTDE